MGWSFRQIVLALAAFAALLICNSLAFAARGDSAVVHVTYAQGDTELDHANPGIKFFIGQADTLKDFPKPLRRMMFTRRTFNQVCGVVVDAPKGAKVFLLIQSGNTTTDSRQAALDAGFNRDSSLTIANIEFDVFSQECTESIHASIPGKGSCCMIVAAAKLQVESNDPDAGKLPAADAPPVKHAGPIVINLGGQIDQIRTGGAGHFLVFHLKDALDLTVVDVLQGKVVKKIPAEGDICFCMDRDKLVLVLNNQQVIQRWDLATLTREKTVMLPDDRPVKRAAMGSAGKGPLMMWTDGGCKLFDVGSLKQLTVTGDVQNAVGFGPWLSPDGLTACDWGWSSGPYSLMRLSHLTATTVDSRVLNVDSEDYNESWAMPSADGTQLLRHQATVYDASTDKLVALAPGPLKDASVLPTEDPRFLLALRGENGNDSTSSVAIISAFDRRVLYTIRKAVPVTGGMIGTRSGRICSEPRAHYLPDDKKLVLIPNSDDKVVVYDFDLEAALKATGADYLYAISKPHTVLTVGDKFDYQIQTLSSSGDVKYKLEQGPDGLTISDDGRVEWKAAITADGGKVPVVITLSDKSGQETIHAIELHVLEKPTPTPAAPAPVTSQKDASAGKQPKSLKVTPPGPKAKPSDKAPLDPDLKAIGDKLAKKFQEDLDADSRGNNEYTSSFSITVGKTDRKTTGTGPTTEGNLTLSVNEDRVELRGGDFVDYFSHVEIQLKKVDGIWTCVTAKSTLDMATTSHGPLDMPFPPKTHDLTRTIRGLLEDLQPPDGDPKNNPPKQRAEPPPVQKA